MNLRFPNPSRSFDIEKSRVYFCGYDSVIEVSFYVEANALQKLCPGMSNSKAELLQAFDAERKRIYEVADKVYLRSKGATTYILAVEDF